MKECVVCLESPRTILLSCGHWCLCAACKDTLLRRDMGCPICRAPLGRYETLAGSETQRTFVPSPPSSEEGDLLSDVDEAEAELVVAVEPAEILDLSCSLLEGLCPVEVRLRGVDLRECPALRVLALALGASGVVRLDFSHNPMLGPSGGAATLFADVFRNPRLEAVRADGCGLGEGDADGVGALIGALAAEGGLKAVSVRDNAIEPAVLCALLRCLAGAGVQAVYASGNAPLDAEWAAVAADAANGMRVAEVDLVGAEGANVA